MNAETKEIIDNMIAFKSLMLFYDRASFGMFFLLFY